MNESKNRLPWVIAGVAVGAAAVVIVLVLMNGGTGRGGISLISSPPGKVRFTVTWKYNDFVGNRGDTGAVVLLVPKESRTKLPGAISPLLAQATLDNTRKELANHGAYIAIIGGDGKATITGIKPSKYAVVIVSNNTTDSPKESDRARARLERLFISGGAAGLAKVHFGEVDVPSGDEVELSHDFGITYY